MVQIVNDKAEKTDKEDEDWLPPPRKITDTTKFSEDSIMKELRYYFKVVSFLYFLHCYSNTSGVL